MFNKKAKKVNPLLFSLTALTAFICVGLIFFSAKYLINASGNTNHNNSLKTPGVLDDPLTTKVSSFEDNYEVTVLPSDPQLGDENSKVNIIIFSDFLCSFCADQEENIKALQAKYGNAIKLVWKDYPEKDTNSLSYQAALAGRCADIQGKFWPYHDLLFQASKDDEFNQDTIIKSAQALGLNMEDFQACLMSNLSKNLVEENIREANALKLSGVPFIFVNKQESLGGGNLEDLESMIEEELRK